jgi:6-pyruvoyltetrahydropterin/6-carboxytetrahydropterin synthase
MRPVQRFRFNSMVKTVTDESPKCKSFSCELTVTGKYDEKSGMICDFSKLKQLINSNVVDILDHHNLNDIIENPTAENIVNWIFDVMVEDLDRVGLAIAEIRLWESPDSSIILNPYEELEYNLEDE